MALVPMTSICSSVELAAGFVSGIKTDGFTELDDEAERRGA